MKKNISLKLTILVLLKQFILWIIWMIKSYRKLMIGLTGMLIIDVKLNNRKTKKK